VRLMRGVTQEELAESADIARTMIGRYETTDQLPALETLVRIADALEVSTDYLLGRTGDVNASFEEACIKPATLQRAGQMPRNPEELTSFIRDTVWEMLKKGKPSCHL